MEDYMADLEKQINKVFIDAEKRKEEEDIIGFYEDSEVVMDLNLDSDFDDNWEDIFELIEDRKEGLGKLCRRAEFIGILEEDNSVAFVYNKITEDMMPLIRNKDCNVIILDVLSFFSDKEYNVQFVELSCDMGDE